MFCLVGHNSALHPSLWLGNHMILAHSIILRGPTGHEIDICLTLAYARLKVIFREVAWKIYLAVLSDNIYAVEE